MKLETLQVNYDQDKRIIFLSVNRPDKLNALSTQVLQDLSRFFDNLSEFDQASGIIFFGEGEKAFIAGADIKAMQAMGSHQAREFARLGQDVTLKFESCSLPIIAAVDGFALGGGCEMAMSCDMIYATEKSVFGQPEINLGLLPGFGGTQRLPLYVGRARAKELIYTGKNFSAQEAYDWGLVAKLCPAREDLFKSAQETLDILTKKSPLIVSKCKDALNKGEGLPLAQGLEIERQQFMSVFETHDTKEGLSAFVEKRKPSFKGH